MVHLFVSSVALCAKWAPQEDLPAIPVGGELSNIHQRTTVPVHSNYNLRMSHVDHTYKRVVTPTEPGGHSRPCGVPLLVEGGGLCPHCLAPWWKQLNARSN